MSEPLSHGAIRPSRQPPLLRSHEQQSMTASGEGRLHSPWKRSACDRCRSLKLKCDRDNKNTKQSCIRCTRADVKCFTSSAKSPARLASARANAKFASPACANTDTADKGLHRESQRPIIPATQTNPDSLRNKESAFVMRWPFTHQSEHDATLDIDFDVDMPLPMNQSGQANHFPSFNSDHLSPANPSSTPAAPTLPPSKLSSGVDGVVSQLTPRYSTQTIGDKVNPGILLADLQQSLSKQLVALESEPWDPTTLSIPSSATGASGSDQEPGREVGFNPVAPILASISDFVAVLHLLRKPLPNSSSAAKPDDRQNNEYSMPYIGWPTLVPSSRDTHSSMPVSGSAPAIASPSQKVQSRVHLLTTINCYFLVLSIFDAIFSRLLANSEEPCSQGSTDVHSSSPTLLSSLQNSSSRSPHPELPFVSYFVTPNARQRTRLLVQVVEHQLTILEHHLGLPRPYCVSSTRAEDASKKPAEDSILGRQDSLFLLQAVMRWTTDTDGAGSFHSGEELSRSPVTLSLIDKLKRAQTASEKPQC
ncbi:hypothetical protein F4859DRAFT_472221 [Xylaria cf. heliscus]|nr:hypothetical protein F4859DRAFT_472221 [Xylaria cf. heliscus]